MKHSKTYREQLSQLDRSRLYTPIEALTLVRQLARARFDETVELAVRLGVDPRRADQVVRGTVALPHGTGRTVRVAVFAAGDAAQEAREAGADLVGADDLVERVQNGLLEFDVAIATPDLMAQVGRLGRLLGPRGLMPNPRTGTVTNDVARTVREFKAGRVEFRTDRVGNVHVPIGKVSFSTLALLENFRAVIDELQRAKPAAAKGRYFRSVHVATTMSPSIPIDTNRLRIADEELAQLGAA